MEENNDSKPKKAASKKKTVTDDQKILEAKKKVNELLKGTGFEEKELLDKTEEETILIRPDEYASLKQMETNKADDWIKQELERLSKHCQQLENENLKLRAENQDMKLSGVGSDALTATSDKMKVIELFKHFQDVYIGRKFGERFSRVQLSYPQDGNGLLDLLQSYFPYLQEHRTYRHWG